MIVRATLILLALTGAASAQVAVGGNKYLVFPSLAAVQLADMQICRAHGCDGVGSTAIPIQGGHTLYWLQGGDGSFNNCGQTSGACTPTSYALVVGSPPYDVSNLTQAQVSALLTEAQATAAGFPTPTWQAQQAAAANAAVK